MLFTQYFMQCLVNLNKVFSLDGCIAQACFFCQDETKKVTEQIQDSCSVDDGNVFDQGIGDSGCQNILVIKRS